MQRSKSPGPFVPEVDVTRSTEGLLAWAEDAPQNRRQTLNKKAKLVLEDGTVCEGYSFGSGSSRSGEVVFNTGMVGYPEALTDPSYRGQILVLTYPLIGNYGVPSMEERDDFDLPKYFESDQVQIAGLVVATYSEDHSHWASSGSLGAWLEASGVPAIHGVDTRRLTKNIRESGALLGWLLVGDESPMINRSLKFEDPNQRHLVAEVSTKKVTKYVRSKSQRTDNHNHNITPGRRRIIVAFDCGMKYNIIRYLVSVHDVELYVVPHDYDLETNIDNIPPYDGIFCSNGPGDPARCEATIQTLKKLITQQDIPIFGICLGHQLLALAAGAKSYKMKYGNRGMNQPCVDLRTTRCYMTSQNHGYAIDDTTLPCEWRPLFVNANDHSNEGIIHTSKPFFSVQFHPEAAGGPIDTAFLFDSFARLVHGAPPQLTLLDPSIYRTDRASLKRVLLLGSGGLSIGQAGEFDYSGSQAIKALKEEGLQVILINPNIATVQTSRDDDNPGQFLNPHAQNWGGACADHVYLLPVTADWVRRVLDKEKDIDGIIVSMGGQTALNVGVELWKSGDLQKRGVRVLGTKIDAIIATEDRQIFSNTLKQINERLAESYSANSVDQALEAARKIGYPVLVRAAFTLGGLGSGFAENEDELQELATSALSHAGGNDGAQILIDKDLRGWKEVEYEVVRDVRDNCITVCNMENFDPLGVHTGDSIVVAPSQTLTNREYFKLRATALKVVRHLGIIGECNIQYALNPKSEDACIIEVNARLSRSSALASKATGFPLAYVATKLSLGHDLVSIRNSVTQTTTACFEPSLDYCVVKVPRWDMRKFQRVSTRLGSAMKSVGEVMAIGRSFEEAIQKAVRMVNPNLPGLEGFAASGNEFDNNDDDHLSGAQSSSGISIQGLEQRLKQPNDQRLFAVQLAFEKGYSIDKVHELTKIDRWFLAKLRRIARLRVAVETRFAQQVTENHNTLMRSSVGSGGISASIEALGYDAMRKLKQAGFSDAQIASYARCTEARVRRARLALGVKPAVKQIDTLGGEVPARTNYLYMTYHGDEADVVQSERAVIVLGCGAYCIGSSVEFDWSAVSCVRQCRASGYRAIVVNCNPETVSTDYDVSDRLYFEELSLERVLDIYEQESAWGLVVSVGGQIPNNLAKPLHDCGVHILGTSPQDIERAEDRHKFSAMLDEIGVDQPPWRELQSTADAISFAERVGYPVLVRPSFVLSGAAMNVASSAAELTSFLNEASDVSPDHPVVVSKFIQNAKEIEFDAVASDGHILNYAISEHVENAGVHSGDATLVLPAQKLYVQTQKQVKRIASKIAKHLRISGPFNIQLMARENDVKVIECNLRASRSFPFLSKTLNCNFISLATRVMLGVPARPYSISMMEIDYVCVKAPMFSFTRLRGADPILGVEMASTGEVACLGVDVYGAYLKALESTGMQLPSSSDKKAGKKFFLSISNAHDHAELAKKIAVDLGFHIVASPGTAKALISLGIPNVQSILSSTQEETALSSPRARPAWADATIAQLEQGNIAFVINIPSSAKLSSFCDDQESVTNGYLVRRAAIDFGVGLILNEKSAHLFVEALVRSLNDPVLRTTPFHVDEFYSGAYHDYNQL
eukprot:CAMPEP_0197307038 /NCGR_PEP_ID=MMETSP0891-20130614/4470_1 /TAXON_ID=44058 ORGANISM="Aureoumbra lagunensis, Strain CCMP1510" /NCGR_SAMPLE_ID=MMETSP0891 /ASSEMBLY_ACC=CAM_ASM_000534 /LENGTH=1607 /DNA_ID=CAMNT_0042790011 /DNA_START=52 /DNA_END=4875 /DNA_ORIENTATION=+